MRILNWNNIKNHNFNKTQQFFVELLYSLTHQRSLDSYRVKCMNSRTLLRELNEELIIGLVDKKDLSMIYQETIQCINNDCIIEKYFLGHSNILIPLLNEIQENKNSNNKSKHKELLYAVNDMCISLESNYFNLLCNELDNVIKTNDENRIHSLLISFLSDLYDQGWDLQSLFQWHYHFIDTKKVKLYTFENNLEYMLQNIKNANQKFIVILRLTGGKRLQEVNELGFFKVEKDISHYGYKFDNAKHFTATRTMTRFATCEIESVNFLPAAIKARESIDEQLSLLRLDYERNVVKVEDNCFIVREIDKKEKELQAALPVPNPIEYDERKDYDKFIQEFNYVCSNENIDLISRNLLRAAIRQYKFGSDSANYRDKFLNWWMGIEALARVKKEQGIGESVQVNISNIMLLPYFQRILLDLLQTLVYCKINLSPESIDSIDTSNYILNIKSIISLLQSEVNRNDIEKQLEQYPILHFRFKWITKCVCEPNELSKRYTDHLHHLEWHLQRMYRIRCCIVHGSSIRHHLELVSANLEYYLKQSIHFSIKSFIKHDHIRSLEEIYDRAKIITERNFLLLKDLNNKTSNEKNTTIQSIILSDIVNT